MNTDARERLLKLVHHTDGDPGEVALLCSAAFDHDLDVDAGLLRLDTLADGLITSGFRSTDPTSDAREIADYVAVRHGITGDDGRYRNPENALISRVLDRRRGLPITCAIIYVAIARRVGVRAYLINLPGHVVAAVAGPVRPIVVDTFHGGLIMEEADIARRVRQASAGQASFHRAMLRPATVADVVRRLLNNLTRDYKAIGDVAKALTSVELKLALPNASNDDWRVYGDLLSQFGRFDAAARAFEHYLEATDGLAFDDPEVRRAAIRARARMN